MSRHTMTRRELLDAAHADVREALHGALEGFTACPRCGHEDPTSDLDMVGPLRQASSRLAILRSKPRNKR